MAPPKHAPPALSWRTPPAGAVPPKAAAQAKSAAAAQPMRAFAAHQRPPGKRESSSGDELVGGADGLFQLRGHGNQVLSRPNGTYNFVRVQGATRNQTATMLSSNAPHASLAAGRPVLYAGTAAFDGGKLQWWSNYSGTYQPQAEFHRQAALPDDKFVPWQRLQMGGVAMQRGMLADRRATELPGTDDAKPVRETAPKPESEPAKRQDAPAAAKSDSADKPVQMKRDCHPPPPTRFGPKP